MDLFDLLAERDFHVHSTLSSCARPEMTLANILERARARSIKALGVSDHILRAEDAERLLVLKKEIEERRAGRCGQRRGPDRAEGSNSLYFGCELDLVAIDRPAAPAGALSEYEFVNVAVNHFHLDTVDDPPEEPLARADRWLELMASAARLPRADVIAHPFKPLEEPFEGRPLFYALSEERLGRLFSELSEKGIALEFRDLFDCPVSVYGALRGFYGLALECGVGLAPNSDAHALDRMGFQTACVRLARDVGFGEKNLWRVEESRSARHARPVGPVRDLDR